MPIWQDNIKMENGVWNGLIFLSKGYNGGLSWKWWWNVRFHKSRTFIKWL